MHNSLTTHQSIDLLRRNPGPDRNRHATEIVVVHIYSFESVHQVLLVWYSTVTETTGGCKDGTIKLVNHPKRYIIVGE